MKPDIHPQTFDTHVTCSCGNSFSTRATVDRLQLDICSNCHPFFTGTQKLVDTQGQVERFQQRLRKARPRPAARVEPVSVAPEPGEGVEAETES